MSTAPFHDNTNTPSARIFRNPDGDTLYCYSERKVFRPSDFIRLEIINTKLENVFFRLWNKVGEGIQESLIDEFSNKLDIRHTFNEEQEAILNQFKEGKCSIKEFNSNLLNILNGGV